MPSLRKLSPAEILEAERRPLGVRAQVAQEYDAYVAGFAAGDLGRVELAAGEQRNLVRSRLQAAARRRGLALRFRPGPGAALFFRVEPALPAVAKSELMSAAPAVEQQGSTKARAAPTPAVPALFRLVPTPATPMEDQQESRGTKLTPAPAAPAEEQQGSAKARREPAPPQPRRQPTATERYRDVLPRWMRDGPQRGRSVGSKRRGR